MTIVIALDLILAFALQFFLVNSRHAPPPTPGQPISLQLPNINATKPLLQIGNSLDMAASNGRLEPVSYPIPNTQMTLDIISDPNVSLWPSR